MEIDNDSAYMTDLEVQAARDMANRVDIKSNFNFISSHNGFRKGNLHMFLGIAHGGKSTLVRTLLLDALSINPGITVGVWLSEETKFEFKTEFALTGFSKKANNLKLFSEQDCEEFKNGDDIFRAMSNFIKEKNIDLFFYDNITTSQVYLGRKYEEQLRSGYLFKTLCHKTNIPFVLFGHTNGTITENYQGIIEMENMEGAKIYTKVAQFFYVLQSFYNGGARSNTVRITKHRGQTVDSRLFKLLYAAKVRLFVKDVRMTFNDLRELYKNRDKL